MNILGIESSCDDTAASIVDDKKNILSNVIISQNEIHHPYRGVVPELAARNHVHNIDKVVMKALEEANISLSNVDVVSATAGPGLIGGLLVGLMAGKIIAQSKKLPFVAINHLEAHALTARLTNNIKFPYLLLLISGGHSEFYIVKEINDYIHLGGTLDDALGEAFDKIARALELDFPGGAALEKLAKEGNPDKYRLPRPLLRTEGVNFSFSGLKTAVLRIMEKESPTLKDLQRKDLAASFQQAVSDILCDRINNAIKIFSKNFPNSNTIVISGGVASNSIIRENIKTLSKMKGYNSYFPPKNLCTDNAAMIAWTGFERFNRGLVSNLNFKAMPRWPLENRKDYP